MTPFRGSGPAVTDLLGGQVDYMFDSITSARPHIDSGKLRAIAVTTKTRSSALPQVPTVAESGLPAVKQRFAGIGAEPIGSSPQQLKLHLQSEMDKWAKVIAERAITAD